MTSDFLCERRLAKLNPQYHGMVRDTAVVMQYTLEKYKTYFPVFCDHTSLHSLNVIDFCNRLIGEENIDKLNDDEIYVLLMSAYLHDSGMGVSDSDYKKLRDRIVNPDYRASHPDTTIQREIRDFHHEFSAGFIRKNYALFDIPTKEHVEAIVQVSRGHRKTDLWSEIEYPVDYPLPTGKKVCLPYLAALIRLADEMDIAEDRNLDAAYDEMLEDAHVYSQMQVKHLRMEEDRFVLECLHPDPRFADTLYGKIAGLEEKLKYCHDVVNSRTQFVIRQSRVDVEYLD